MSAGDPPESHRSMQSRPRPLRPVIPGTDGVPSLIAEVYGGHEASQRPAFTTDIITPKGLFTKTEVNSPSGIYPLGILLNSGTFNEVYFLSNNEEPGANSRVARVCRVPLAEGALQSLLSCLPADRYSQTAEGDYRLNFAELGFAELLELRQQIDEIADISTVNPDMFFAMAPLQAIKAAATVIYLAASTSVGQMLNPPQEVLIQNHGAGKKFVITIENQLRSTTWDNLPEHLRLEVIVKNPTTNAINIGAVFERLYLEAHQLIHGEVKPGHIGVSPPVVIDWDTARFVELESPPSIIAGSRITIAPESVSSRSPNKSSEIFAFINSIFYGLLKRTPREIEKCNLAEEHLNQLIQTNRLTLLENSGAGLRQEFKKLGINMPEEIFVEYCSFLKIAVGSNPVARPGSFSSAALLCVEPIAAVIDNEQVNFRHKMAYHLLKIYNLTRTAKEIPDEIYQDFLAFLANCPTEYVAYCWESLSANWGQRPRSVKEFYNDIVWHLQVTPLA